MKFKTDKANSRKKSNTHKENRRKIDDEDSDKVGLHRSVKQLALVAMLSVGLIIIIYILQTIFFHHDINKTTGTNINQQVQHAKHEDIQEYKQILDEAGHLLKDMKAKELLANNANVPVIGPALTNMESISTTNTNTIPYTKQPPIQQRGRGNTPMLRGDEKTGPRTHSTGRTSGGIVLSPNKIISTPNNNINSNSNSNSNSNNLQKGSRKDLVIGMAQDTDPRNLAVFCGSLRQ